MRKIIVVLFLLCAKIAQAQIYIDSYRFAGAAPANLLLDDYPGATAAYSLRKLDKDYTGSAIRIRTAGGSETDIGFDSNGDLNTAAITTFCAGTTCTVATWYDQSGNGNNVTQTTAANQPTIYTGGAIIEENGRPSIYFDNVNDFFEYNLTISTNSHWFFVNKFRSLPNSDEYLIDTDTRVAIYGYTGNIYALYDGSIKTSSRPVTFNQQLVNLDYAGVNSVLSVNGITQNISLTTLGFSSIRHARNYGSATNYAPLQLSEVIFYPTRQTSNRANIENNINSYYSIY